jgi:hypothetical protein
VYFEGVMSGGDLLYVTRGPEASGWSTPVFVNSTPRSAIGVGPIDGGQIALGQHDTLHVVWFQTNPTRIFYARRGSEAEEFDPQRTLWELDDGSFEASPTVAADSSGNVFVFWHAGGREDAQRAVYMVSSMNGGETFGEARRVSVAGEGACGCCNMAALAGEDGTIYVSYRGAGENVRRGQRLLTSVDGGRRFSDQLIQQWQVGACPVTTTTLSTGPSGVREAWETEGQVYVAGVDRLGQASSPEGAARIRRKNPAVAVNRRGQTLLAWGDGPGLRAGGTLHWRIFDPDGRPTRHFGDETSIPSGSAPAVVSQPDDSFLLMF